MTNTNPTFTETVEVPLDELLTFGAFYECFADLLRDRIDATINAEAYENLEESLEDFDLEDLVCPLDEILVTSYAMVGCPRSNVAEFTVEWVRDFALDEPTLSLVR